MLAVSLLLVCSSGVAPDTISLEKALEQNLVTAEGKGLGGHSGRCVKLEVANLTSDRILLHIEAGRQLVSIDTTEQDILIVKDEFLELSPSGKMEAPVKGYCCESVRKSPGPGSKFTSGFLANEKLRELARHLSIYSCTEGNEQFAVWVISNNHAIAGIEASTECGKKLKAKVAQILRVEIPWYTIDYLKPDSTRLFSSKHSRLTGNVKYFLTNNTVVSIRVKYAGRVIAHEPLPETVQNTGEYDFPLNINVRGWPSGKYTVEVIENEQRLLLSKAFTL